MITGLANARRNQDLGKLIGERDDSTVLRGDRFERFGVNRRPRVVFIGDLSEMFVQRFRDRNEQRLTDLTSREPDLVTLEIDLGPAQ